MELYFCIPLWNRGDDIKLLLSNLERIYININKKINFHTLISDFYSSDINLEIEKKKYSYQIDILYINEPFNISKGIKYATDRVKDGNIIMILDADTVFDNDFNIIDIINLIKENESFYCPIVSFEYVRKDFKKFVMYNKEKKLYIPIKDTRGEGMILCYSSDWKKSKVFIGSEFLDSRGETWGQHDTYMVKSLENIGLKKIRLITDKIWLRKNNKNNTKWDNSKPNDVNFDDPDDIT